MMSSDQQYYIQFNDFQTHIMTSVRELRFEKSFTDVTLVCEGQICDAHRVILSACSSYFKALLEDNPSTHPTIIVEDVTYFHMQALLDFMYEGEVYIQQEQLPVFMKAADRLKVKGLSENSSFYFLKQK